MNIDDIIKKLYKEMHMAEEVAKEAEINEDYPGACGEMGYAAGIKRAIHILRTETTE